MSLRPFFCYYGGKWRVAPRYPQPVHDTIVEPFAGAAGYSLRHPEKQVMLLDLDEFVCGVWDYLIHVSADEIRSLPAVVGHTSEMIGAPAEARWLVGWWLNKGTASPRPAPSSRFRSGIRPRSHWGPEVRDLIASQVDAIRHWTIDRTSYETAPDIEATWFIDPPYAEAGKHYRFGSAGVNYTRLAEWARARDGQVIVCENEGASWLPFEPFAEIKADGNRRHGVSREVIWLGGTA